MIFNQFHNIKPPIKLLSFYTWLIIVERSVISSQIKAMLKSSSHRGWPSFKFHAKTYIYIYISKGGVVLYQKRVLKRGRKALWIQQPENDSIRGFQFVNSF